ncbi:MAG: glycoside hydrolase family 3 protein [Bacilli bacterium]|nr:glycoside hydrolase family 3 protein [Bacilli bacterium]
MNINQLSIEEKIGQMLCFAFRGTTYNHQLKTLIENYHVGNVVEFAHNITSYEQVKQLNDDIQLHAKHPIFISLDQEGGMVRRLMEDVTYLPGAMSLSATGEDIYPVTRACGEDLKQLGFHINYAPVADINSNPLNPVINSRSYGDNPQKVAEQVVRASKAFQDAMILPMVKHFPGHGDTNVDSHLGLPIVKKDKATLFQEELVPYIEAIREGCEGVMISHILYDAIDPAFPSSLSYPMITELLKQELGFRGLITTDSLTMAAIWGRYSIEEIVKNGIMAGNDILVFCGKADLEEQITIIKTFRQLVMRGEIPLSRLDESVEKIIALKQKYTKVPRKLALNRLAPYTDELIEKSITKVYDCGLLPLQKNDSVLMLFPKIHLASLVDNEEEGYETFKKHLPYPETIIDEEMGNLENIVQMCTKYDKILLATYQVKTGDYFTKLYEQLDKSKVILVCLRSPYDGVILKKSGALICTYDCTKESIGAVCQKCKDNTFTGSLPVRLEV